MAVNVRCPQCGASSPVPEPIEPNGYVVCVHCSRKLRMKLPATAGGIAPPADKLATTTQSPSTATPPIPAAVAPTTEPLPWELPTSTEGATASETPWEIGAASPGPRLVAKPENSNHLGGASLVFGGVAVVLALLSASMHSIALVALFGGAAGALVAVIGLITGLSQGTGTRFVVLGFAVNVLAIGLTFVFAIQAKARGDHQPTFRNVTSLRR